MSLFKAYNLILGEEADLEVIEENFLEVVGNVADTDKADMADVIAMVTLYATYSCSYLQYIATTLRDDEESSQTMKFMNSYIAETVNKAGLHYYNKEHGYSIIDKAVQAALDNGGTVSCGDVTAFIEEIEASYIEEEIEEVTEEAQDGC